VTRILTNEAGTRVIGVEYFDNRQQKQVREASVVALAAWSAQNSRLTDQLRDKQARRGPRQRQRPRRPIRDVASCGLDMGHPRRLGSIPTSHPHGRHLHDLCPVAARAERMASQWGTLTN
jgi:hypothetical protein